MPFLSAGGYHPVRLGEKFKQGRYVVLKKLGWGHFSTVWLVLDNHNHTFAALKVRTQQEPSAFRMYLWQMFPRGGAVS